MAIESVELKKKIDFAVDLNILMTVEYIAQKEGREIEDVLPEFICSDTGKLLYDEESRFWWSSAPEIAEIYWEEKREAVGNFD